MKISYDELIIDQGLDFAEYKDEINKKSISYWVNKAMSKGMTEGEAIEFVAEDLCISITDVVNAIG